MQNLGPQTRSQTCAPLQREHGVLTNGPSGKSPAFSWMTDLEAHFLHHCFLLKCVNNEQIPMVQKQNSRVGLQVDPPAHLSVFRNVFLLSPHLCGRQHIIYVFCVQERSCVLTKTQCSWINRFNIKRQKTCKSEVSSDKMQCIFWITVDGNSSSENFCFCNSQDIDLRMWEWR